MARDATPMPARRAIRVTPTLFCVWTCAAGLLAAVGVRAAFSWGPDLPEPLQQALADRLDFSTRVMMHTFGAFHWYAAPFPAFLAVLLVRPRWCLRRDGDRFAVRAPWLWVLWPALLFLHAFLDFNVAVARLVWATLPVGILLTRLRLPSLPASAARAVRAALWAALVGAGATRLPAAPDVLAGAVWALGFFAVFELGPRRLPPRDLALATAAGIAAVQVLAASRDVVALALLLLTFVALGGAAVAAFRALRTRTPRLRWAVFAPVPVVTLLLTPLVAGAADALFDTGARVLGEGLAYSFCELPGGDRILAVVPHCQMGGPHCADGELVEYDAATLAPLGAHRPFAGDFNGRLEQAVCLADEIQVGMCCTRGKSMDNEATITIVPRAGGWSEAVPNPHRRSARRLVYDEARDALFYVGNTIQRVDRRTGAVVDNLERVFVGADARPGPGVYTAGYQPVHQGRRSLFVAEFLRGDRVYELDLDTLALRRAFDTHDGGVIGLTVDEPLDRLLVSGVYGIDAFDLETGQHVERRRTGTLARAPVVDRYRGLVYVPTTIEGRIEVFDRESLARLGALPVGMETRNAHLTRDGRWLLGSTAHTHVAWDAEALAARFLGRPRPGAGYSSEAGSSR